MKTPDLPTQSELEGLLPSLNERGKRELDRVLDPIWEPLPGPQKAAYWNEADELYYGGAAGGGKTDLLLGLAATRHRRSIIFRREYPQLREIIERSREIIGGRGRYNANDHIWRLHDGRLIEFGAVQHEDDKQAYQGRAHDLKCFDELPHFTETQYRFLIGWNRTTARGQRSRVVGAGNPPTSADGEWVIRRWAAWLDGQHPRPAKPGELRWYATVDGKEVEREDGRPFQLNGATVRPRSRTFIPARLSDNPYLTATGYEAVLQAMPEPLRSQMLYGDFSVGLEDDPWQVIPTAWVRAAQGRWTALADDRATREGGPAHGLYSPPASLGQDAVGVDVARGGNDQTVLSRRYGTWFAPLEKHAGASTPDGPAVAGFISMALVNGGHANIDAIGVGASAYDHCKLLKLNVKPINFAEAAPRGDRTGVLKFVNLRAWAYWSLREALDPDRGDNLALPPDAELLGDLCAPKWTVRLNGIQVESKDDVAKRLGRSPDCGDAVVLAALPWIGPAPLQIHRLGPDKPQPGVLDWQRQRLR